jgi:hypothetical protein
MFICKYKTLKCAGRGRGCDQLKSTASCRLCIDHDERKYELSPRKFRTTLGYLRHLLRTT